MSERLKVGIIMGSKSDIPTMFHAGRALRTLGLVEKLDYEDRVISAHRTPKHMIEYANTAEERGIQIIIAGAGGSAHLPGMVASETHIPVIGVAITSSPDTMNRALGAMIGMPEGKPLATYQDRAGAFNAGLFAGRILALHDPELRQAYLNYESILETDVLNDDRELEAIGITTYMEEHNVTPK